MDAKHTIWEKIFDRSILLVTFFQGYFQFQKLYFDITILE